MSLCTLQHHKSCLLRSPALSQLKLSSVFVPAVVIHTQPSKAVSLVTHTQPSKAVFLVTHTQPSKAVSLVTQTRPRKTLSLFCSCCYGHPYLAKESSVSVLFLVLRSPILRQGKFCLCFVLGVTVTHTRPRKVLSLFCSWCYGHPY